MRASTRLAAPDALAALRLRVETLERVVEALQKRTLPGAGPRDADDRAVVLALAASIDRAAMAVGAAEPLAALRFTAKAVRRHAMHDADLRAALVTADAVSTRSIGRLFARIEGHPIDGLVLQRCGGRSCWRLVAISAVSAVSADHGGTGAE